MQRSLSAPVLSSPDRLPLQERPRPVSVQGGLAGALSVLVVEDDDSVRSACAMVAGSLGCHVHVADSVPGARAVLAHTTIDVVMLDMRLPGGTGELLLQEIREIQPRAFVVIMTAYATVTSAVEMMRTGVGDFLHKPFALEQVTTTLERAAHRRQVSEQSRVLQDRLRTGISAGRLVGQSPAMQKLYRLISKVACTLHPVILSGEAGSGKEALARSIHANGPNALSPFIPVSCDALRPAQLEQELFGRITAQGAPDAALPGVLVSAGDGTVYLDEIAALDPAVQARLARALAEKRIHPPGADTSVAFHARLLVASTRDLRALAEEGRFRKDLYYKLNVLNLCVPPLRERPGDIPLLAEHFLERRRRDHDLHFVLSDAALEALARYPWPGNVGELESELQSACAVTSGPVLQLEDLSSHVRGFHASEVAAAGERPEAAEAWTQLSLEELERKAIAEALHHLKGDKIAAAKVLRIGKTTLYRKLKEYGLADDAL